MATFRFMAFVVLSAFGMVLELHLNNRQGRGIKLHLDGSAVGIPTDDLVAAVIDLDPAQLPALFSGQPDNGGPGLPLGHRHFAVVSGLRGGGEQHPEKQEPC